MARLSLLRERLSHNRKGNNTVNSVIRLRLFGASAALFLLMALLFAQLRMTDAKSGKHYALLGPEHMPPGSELISQGSVDPRDASHPLSLAAPDDAPLPHEAVIYRYLDVEQYVVFTPQGTAVMSYRYRYDDTASAERAAASLADKVATRANVVPLQESAMIGRFDGSAARLFRIEGTEPGNVLYWLVVPTDRHLQLLIVDGFDEGTVAATLDGLLDRWLAGRE